MPVIVQKESFITTAVINRPGAMNAINFEVMDRLETLLDEAEKDRDLRLLIVTGKGKSFISGGDLREFHQIKDSEGAKKMSQRMLDILTRIQQLPFWTLAAVNGHTYGGGWETLLAFDFCIAAASARFGFTQGKFYLPPGWGGLTRLAQTAGEKQASYWLASQKVIDAQTACRCGIVQDVFPDETYEKQLAELKKSLTLNDRTFISYLKQKNESGFSNEIEPFSRFWESEEHQKRVDEFLQKNRV